MKFLIKEIPLDGSRHRRKWIVDIDQGEDLHYRSRVSFNAFMSGKNKRNFNFDNGVLYYGESLEEVKMINESSKRFGGCGTDFDSIQQVPSIWEFYKIIGYDYKKKRFIG